MGIVHILHHLGVTAPLLVPILPLLRFMHPYETPEIGGLVVGIVPLLQLDFLFIVSTSGLMRRRSRCVRTSATPASSPTASVPTIASRTSPSVGAPRSSMSASASGLTSPPARCSCYLCQTRSSFCVDEDVLSPTKKAILWICATRRPKR